MSTLPLPDQIRNALLQHEVGGNYAYAGTLSLVPSGRSGYSVGAFQYDFSQHANDAATLANFKDLLTGTASTTGLTAAQIDQIMQGITSVGGSNGVSPYIGQINQALQTAQGVAFTTSVDAATLTTDIGAVESLIIAANLNPNGAGALTNGNLDPTVIAELAQYVNQFDPNNVTQLTAFLTGGTAYLGDPSNPQPFSSDGTLGQQDLETNFFSHLYQFTQNPDQYQNFLDSAALAGQTSSSGTVIDVPDATIAAQQADDGGMIVDVASVATDGDIVESVVYSTGADPSTVSIMGEGDSGPATSAFSSPIMSDDPTGIVITGVQSYDVTAGGLVIHYTPAAWSAIETFLATGFNFHYDSNYDLVFTVPSGGQVSWQAISAASYPVAPYPPDLPNPPSDPAAPPLGGGGVGGASGDMGDGNEAISPLVLDLTGQGINLTALSYTSPYFDLTGSGFAHKTGWIGAGTGLLCLDTNGDGQINSGLELFGTAGGASDGFAALGALDTNGDGVIDSNDAQFADLRVWVDANGNGVTDPGELLTLAQLGIVSINLDATAVNETIAGNSVNLISTYTLSDGTQRTIGDAWFDTSDTYTRPDATPTISATVAALPELQGYGTLTDLQSAMMADPTLESDVQVMVSDVSQAPANVLFDVTPILLEWSGSTAIDPNSRGGLFDARELDFLEKYTGIPFYNASYNNDWGGAADVPRWRATIPLQQGWNSAYDGAAARLLLQAGYNLPEFTYNQAADFVLPATSLLDSFASLYARLGDVTASNAGQWEIALRVADAFRLDAHLATDAYLATVASSASDSVAAIASALIAGENFAVSSSGAISLTGVTASSSLYAGPAVRLIEVDGVDSLTPPALSNVIHYDAGSGALEVKVTDYSDTPNNVLQFGAGISATQITGTTDSAGNITLTDGISGDQITIDGARSAPSNGIQVVRFADGTIWTNQQLLLVTSQINGTAGADKLSAVWSGEMFDGKGAPAGSQDYEQGDGGGDAFIFKQGYGQLEIEEVDYGSDPQNVLRLGPGITAAQVSVTSDGCGNLILTDGTAGDQVTLDNGLGSYNGVQQVQFADGTIWSKLQLIAAETTGTTAADKLYGSPDADTFDGKGAPTGSHDYEQGEGGNDIFIYDRGYGQLEIDEVDFGSGPENVLRLGPGITPAQVSVTSDGSGNLILTDGTAGDQITLDGQLGNYDGVQQVQFADGTTWSSQQLIALETTGTAGADSLYGTAGSDTFDGKGAPAGSQDYEQGGGGNDTFIFKPGYGRLEIDEYDWGSKPNNVLTLGTGIQHADLRVTKTPDGNGVVLTIGNSGDQVTLDDMLVSSSYGVQTMTFSDGTTWTAKQIDSLAKTGTTKADTINGTTGNDVFDGHGGADTITGKGGYDTYLFRSGYGHLTIYNAQANGTSPQGEIDLGAGLTEQKLWFANSNGDLIITALGSQDQVSVKGWFGSNASSQLAEIRSYDGLSLDSAMSTLVSAMATYSGNHPGFNPVTATQMPTDSALQAALAAAWHH